jgi:hypothetical protein
MLEAHGDGDGARRRWSTAAKAGAWKSHARSSSTSLQKADSATGARP